MNTFTKNWLFTNLQNYSEFQNPLNLSTHPDEHLSDEAIIKPPPPPPPPPPPVPAPPNCSSTISSNASTIVTYIDIVIALFGLLFNLSFWMILIRVPQTRKSTYWYMLNLSVADTLYLISASIISIIVQFVYGPFNHPIPYEKVTGYDNVCFFFPLSNFLPQYASVATLVVIAIERYIAVCHPFKMKMLGTNSVAAKFIIGIWAFGLIFTMPDLVIWCYSSSIRDNFLARLFLRILSWLPFLGGLIAITVLYGIAFRQLFMRNKFLGSAATSDKRHRDSKQAMIMLFFTTFSFFVCILPSVIVRIINSIGFMGALEICFTQGNGYRVFELLRLILLFVNSAKNPLIFLAFSQKYKGYFRKAFMNCYRNNNKNKKLREDPK